MTENERQLMRDAIESINILFCAVLVRDENFLPSYSGKPWETLCEITRVLREENPPAPTP